jgi:hypothetical protein
MCKTNVKINLYYANISKHEHENNMTRPWCKIVLEKNDESYFYLYSFGDLVQGSFQKDFYVCIESNFLRTFLTKSQL